MSTIYCMNCGAELAEGARFCTECGSPTRLGAGLVEPEELEQVRCPACGALNDPTNAYCGSCGVALATSPTPALLSATEKHTYGLHEREPLRPKGLLAGMAVAMAVACIAGGAWAIASSLGSHGEAAGSGVTAPSVMEQPADDSGDATETTPSTGSAGVEVRGSLADYSWEDLGIIGREMTSRGSRDEALKIASEYHLADDAGHMSDATKDLEIPGYATVSMRLIDVYHDDLANGEGKAGLTFMASGISLTHRMNATDDITGGWEGSELRAWLNGDVFQAIDEDVRTSICAIDKRTDNVGHSTDAACVTSTVDYLWVPSMVELMGPIDWVWPSDPDNSGAYNAITNAEGTQYARFADMNVVGVEANAGLVLSGSDGATPWWERSCSQSGVANFRGVGTTGDPAEIWGASTEQGVALCFCM